MAEQESGNIDVARQHPFLPADSIVKMLQTAKTGHISYEDIIGVNSYTPLSPWDEDDSSGDAIIRPQNFVPPAGESKDRSEELGTARRGLGSFRQVMLTAREAAGAPTITLPDGGALRDADLASASRTKGVIYKIFHNQFEASWQDEQGEPAPLMPWLAYQNGKPYVPGEPIPGSGGVDFLHFGTASKEHNDSTFSGSVRIYMSPRVEDTAQAVADVCRRFFEREGYIPRGKFVEDATAVGSQDRVDRSIFWAHNPEELSELLANIAAVSEERPEFFEGRSPLMLGTPVLVEGREIPTVRISQDLPLLAAGQEQPRHSFNQSRVVLLNEALHTAFPEGVPEQPTNSDAERYIAALKHASESAGVNDKDFNFNATQDMSVIDQATSLDARQTA